MLHELGSLIKSLAVDLAFLGSMLFLVCLQFPGAGKRWWVVSANEDWYDDSVAKSVDMLLVLLMVLWNSQLTPCFLYSPWQQDVRIRATEIRSKARGQLEVIQHMIACGLMTSIIYLYIYIYIYIYIDTSSNTVSEEQCVWGGQKCWGWQSADVNASRIWDLFP